MNAQDVQVQVTWEDIKRRAQRVRHKPSYTSRNRKFKRAETRKELLARAKQTTDLAKRLESQGRLAPKVRRMMIESARRDLAYAAGDEYIARKETSNAGGRVFLR